MPQGILTKTPEIRAARAVMIPIKHDRTGPLEASRVGAGSDFPVGAADRLSRAQRVHASARPSGPRSRATAGDEHRRGSGGPFHRRTAHHLPAPSLDPDADSRVDHRAARPDPLHRFEWQVAYHLRQASVRGGAVGQARGTRGVRITVEPHSACAPSGDSTSAWRRESPVGHLPNDRPTGQRAKAPLPLPSGCFSSGRFCTNGSPLSALPPELSTDASTGDYRTGFARHVPGGLGPSHCPNRALGKARSADFTRQPRPHP